MNSVGERHTLFKQRLEVLGGGDSHNSVCTFLELVDAAAFAAERDTFNASEGAEEHNTAACKKLSICKAVLNGHFNNKVNAVLYSDLSSLELVHKSRLATLNVVTAHNCNDVSSTCLLLGFFYLVNVSVMERIVFADDSVCFH